MIIKCIALDDEPLALEKMANYIRKTPFLELVGTCRSGFEVIDCLSETEADLLFADINMPDINGLDFVKTLDKKPQVIFTTAFSEYAFEGFKVNALDYLLKPIGYNDFLRAANKARNHFKTILSYPERQVTEKKYLFVKADYKIVKINIDDIIYIEGMREYVRIHLTVGKPVMPLISLRALEEELPSDKFMRVHRSYIVNLQKITILDHSRILFDGKEYIPVSEQYKESFQKFISMHLLG
jgi:two-component system, LytTR family, response regulator LytT